jgi:hypothetical protein
MWVASGIAALCFVMFWVARGAVPASASTLDALRNDAPSWFLIWFSISGAAFSGISGMEFLIWLLGHPWVRTISDFSMGIDLSYVLGPIGLLLMVWVWFRLRHTRYRDMAVILLTIILLYASAVAAMYLRAAAISIDDRHFRYAGILFFLLLLTAADQWHIRFAKGLACLAVIVLGLYGLKNSVTGAYAQMRAGYYDPLTRISQYIVSPTVLEYMRSEITRHNFRRPIALVPTPSAGISLPRVRILYIPGQYLSLNEIVARTWAGRTDKIFVVVQEEMRLNGKAEAILRSFIGYDFKDWSQMTLDGMVIYTQ